MNRAAITCNKCDALFLPSDCKQEQVEDGDLIVSFFRCPYCKKPYLILAADAEMRNLIERRKAIRQKIKMARAKKFRESTFKKYFREDEEIKKKQDAILGDLQKRGNEVLARDKHA